MPSWGEAPWHVEVDAAATALPDRCDVAVVGAGFTGLSSAYHLARRGLRVAVLEAADVGAGASGRTGGLVLEGTAAGPLDQVDNCLDRLAAVVDEAGIDCELTLPGCWTVRHAPRPSGPPGWRDGEGWIVRDGRDAGGTIDPGKLVAGLARAALAAGATIHAQTPGEHLESRGESDVLVRSGKREIVARQVVLALNAYTTQLLALPVSFRSALTLALCTEPADVATRTALDIDDGRPFYTHDLPYLWGRAAADGRLIFGAGLLFAHDGDVRRVDLADPDGRQSMRHLEARVRGLHPALAAVAVTHRWGGPIAFLHGGVPILSRVPAMPGVIVHAGCAGHGVALGVRVGQLIAAAVADSTPLPAWGALP
jgi:glycine/D-amino acid oxidase-like deaminating enzyme